MSISKHNFKCSFFTIASIYIEHKTVIVLFLNLYLHSETEHRSQLLWGLSDLGVASQLSVWGWFKMSLISFGAGKISKYCEQWIKAPQIQTMLMY